MTVPDLEALEAPVREEIEALHRFFVGWFSGASNSDAFEPEFLRRFDAEFLLIPPAGSVLGLGELAERVRNAHDTNPEFRIAIRNVQVRRASEQHVLATYEEWQRNALASTPPDNGRVASVLFARPVPGQGGPLRWLHIHETWMPEAITAVGPYDF